MMSGNKDWNEGGKREMKGKQSEGSNWKRRRRLAHTRNGRRDGEGKERVEGRDMGVEDQGKGGKERQGG